MKISVRGDADIFWPEGFRTPEPKHLPYWDLFGVVETRSPCMGRYFISTSLPVFDVPPDGLMHNMVGFSLSVEFAPGDALITEMCEGGGRTWVELFLSWDLVLSSTGKIFGSRSTSLVSPKSFERLIQEKLSRYGNTGAWELYRQYAEAVYTDTTFDSIPESRAERIATWDQFLYQYAKGHPGRRVA